MIKNSWQSLLKTASACWKLWPPVGVLPWQQQQEARCSSECSWEPSGNRRGSGRFKSRAQQLLCKLLCLNLTLKRSARSRLQLPSWCICLPSCLLLRCPWLKKKKKKQSDGEDELYMYSASEPRLWVHCLFYGTCKGIGHGIESLPLHFVLNLLFCKNCFLHVLSCSETAYSGCKKTSNVPNVVDGSRFCLLLTLCCTVLSS